jgi:hypothetical protein
MRVFEREIHVYDKFQRLISKHQHPPALSTDKKLPRGVPNDKLGVKPSSDGKIHLPVPKVYFHEVGIDAACIVMEDLKHSGFRMNDKRVAMTLEHVRLGVVAEATYAALGINAKKRMGTEKYLLANGQLTPEPFESPPFEMMMNHTIFPSCIGFAKGINQLVMSYHQQFNVSLQKLTMTFLFIF